VSTTNARKLSKANTPKELSDRMQRWHRQRDSSGVDWAKVDRTSVVMALHALLASGTAVMFAPAAGGTGVMVKVYEDGNSHAEFAMTAEDVTILLDSIVDVVASSAEDLRKTCLRPEHPVSAK